MSTARALLAPLFFAIVAVNALAAQDWPRFRGPDGAGHATASGLPVEISPGDHAWRIELSGPGHSSPVTWSGQVYLTFMEDEATLILVSVDATDGRVRWKQQLDVEAYDQHGLNSFAASTPTVDAGGVYLTFVSGAERHAVGFGHEGLSLWRRTIGPFNCRHGAGSSAVVAGGLIIVPNESQEAESSVTALDPMTGETRWRLARDGSDKGSFTTPALLRTADGTVELITAGGAHGITGVDLATGAVRWQVATGFRQRCVSSPVLADGLIVQTAGSGGGGKEFVAVRPGSATAPGASTVVHRGVERALPYVPTPIAVGDLLFLWADNGVVTCVRPTDGAQVWQERVGGGTYSSPICVDGRLYNLDRDGNLHVLAAAAQFSLLGTSELGEPTQASLAVADGVLYLRTERHLLAVRGTAEGK